MSVVIRLFANEIYFAGPSYYLKNKRHNLKCFHNRPVSVKDLNFCSKEGLNGNHRIQLPQFYNRLHLAKPYPKG